MNAREIKTFCILFIAVLTALTGVGIVVPLLPVYARDLGASGFYIGMIFGVFSIARTAFIPMFGRASGGFLSPVAEPEEDVSRGTSGVGRALLVDGEAAPCMVG